MFVDTDIKAYFVSDRGHVGGVRYTYMYKYTDASEIREILFGLGKKKAPSQSRKH